MKKGKHTYNEETNYWESMSDILVSLLLCVLLIVMLLVLYLTRIPDKEYVDDQKGDSYADYYEPDHGGGYHGFPLNTHLYDYPTPSPTRDHDGGGGGGWGSNITPHPTPEPQPTILPTSTTYEFPEPGYSEDAGLEKTAVLVQVVDGETQSTIKQQSLAYELYSVDDTLQTLSVYYPQRTDYTRFETNENGVFYLPEKLIPGTYYLHGLTAIQGYDTSEKTTFTITESRDWADPWVVTVELYPARNTIRVQLKDRDSGKKISGGTFNVISQADVITRDGTVRYHAGQIVDTIELDETGYGESEKLYIGEYRLEQVEVPEYYAALENSPVVTVQKSSQTGKSSLTELTQQKTTMRVTLEDALYPGMGLSGAEFTLIHGDGIVDGSIITDRNGVMKLENLQANMTYYLRQVSAPGKYRMDTTEHSFRVDGRGYIGGSASATMTLTNEIVRVAIGIRSMLFNNLASDETVALYTLDNELVKVWSSSAMEQIVEGLTPGEYKLVHNGNMDGAQRVVVRQTKQLQEFYYRQWTTNDIGMVCALAAALVVIIGLMVYLIRRRKRRRQ